MGSILLKKHVDNLYQFDYLKHTLIIYIQVLVVIVGVENYTMLLSFTPL